jgi:hypothetical protein
MDALRPSLEAVAGHLTFMMLVDVMILHIAIFNDLIMASGGLNHFVPALMLSSKRI